MADFKSIRCAYASCDPEDIDDGVVAVPAASDRIYNVVDCWLRSTGNVETATSVDVTDTSGTVSVGVFTAAGLTNGKILRAGTATTGVCAGLLSDLTAGEGILVKTVGSDIATSTAVEYCILYTIDPVHN